MNKKLLSLCLLILSVISITNQAAVTVNKLDNISTGNLVYSGLLPISDTSADQLFFTYYGAKDAKQQSDLKNYPLIVAVGSPGSSAQYLNLAGMGPITLKPDMTTTPNPNTVTNFANVMFIDLLGNGFSFVANTDNFPTKSQDYGVQLTYAINAFVNQSALGQSKVVALVGEGTFLRSLPGLNDIATLSGIIHISAWPQLYAVCRYYGVAGIDLKIFGTSQRVAIESTLISCYNYVTAKKYPQAHSCYQSILNFVQSKTKNANLFDVRLGYNLTEHLPMIQYYFSQSSIVSAFKAPTTRLFETQSNWVGSKTFADVAVNKTASLSQFMKDYLSVKHWYVSGDSDYIAYKQSLKFWLESQLSFVQSAAFKAAKLQDIVIDGKTVGVGKQVKQVKYSQISGSGHYVANDQTVVFNSLLKDWLSGLSSQNKYITEQVSQVVLAEY